MLKEIKNKIEASITKYTRKLDALFSLKQISPVLCSSIVDFLSRKGKRVRPMLFVIGYLGYSRKQAANLYTCALSLEFLHNFMLIHDDIIDKSSLRRGLPSMHRMLDNYLKGYKKTKFNGSDLAIVTGDVIFAIAVNTFLSIKENPVRKEKALKKFTEAAIFTGAGEFVELLCGIKAMDKIGRSDIYRIYDLKTAYYTFCSPLSLGAILAGAKPAEIKKLVQYGLYLGRAFQLKDDILDMFGREKETGKSALSDIKEAKKTLLLWQAYRNSSAADKKYISRTLAKERLRRDDLLKIREIVVRSGSLEYAKKEIFCLIAKAKKISASFKMRPAYKKLLQDFSAELLKI